MDASDPRATHPAVWASAAAGAAVVVVAGLLPGFTVRFEAFIVTGFTERWLTPYERTYTLLGYGHPRYLAAAAGALVIIGAAAWGRRRATAGAPLAAILVVAVAGLSLTSAALGDSNGPSGGVFLHDAVNEVRALVDSSREARDPAFQIADLHAVPQAGWWLTQGALLALALISSVALGRRIHVIGWLALGYVVAAVAVVNLVPGPDCGGERARFEHDPDSNPFGLLAVFGGAACAGLGVGALSRRGWKVGALALLVGLAGALLARYALVAKDCGLDSG